MGINAWSADRSGPVMFWYGAGLWVVMLLALALVYLVVPTAGAQMIPQRGGQQLEFGYEKYQTLTMHAPNRDMGGVKGYEVYSAFNVTRKLRFETEFHEARNHDRTNRAMTLTTGPRYERMVKFVKVYGDVMGGPAVLRLQWLANKMDTYTFAMAASGGVEIPIGPRLQLRTDLEMQRWLSVQGYPEGLPQGLTTTMVNYGLSYRFGGGRVSHGFREDNTLR